MGVLLSLASTPSSAVVRICGTCSEEAAAPAAKLLHVVRHAEGTHNASQEYTFEAHLDAPLTPLGRQQCAGLARQTGSLDVGAIISSSLARAVLTAELGFPAVPLVAEENLREVVIYRCDCRREVSLLQAAFPAVDFSRVGSNEDPIWAKYASIYGDQADFNGCREFNDLEHLAVRARAALEFLGSRPEGSIAVVSHGNFLAKVLFNPDFGGIVEFEDDAVRHYLQRPWGHCELRSVSAVFSSARALA